MWEMFRKSKNMVVVAEVPLQIYMYTHTETTKNPGQKTFHKTNSEVIK